jgi:glycerol-3-phosphate dehydrogenase
VRPLYNDGDDNPSEITRDYTLKLDVEPAPGTTGKGAPLLNIYGGKITTYRKLAEHAVEKLLPFFPNAKKQSWTHAPLQAGATESVLQQIKSDLTKQGLDAGYANRLVNRYGLEAQSLVDRGLGEVFDHTFAEGEIEYLRDHEWARSTDSMLQRRTKTNLLASAQSLERIRELIAKAL